MPRTIKKKRVSCNKPRGKKVTQFKHGCRKALPSTSTMPQATQSQEHTDQNTHPHTHTHTHTMERLSAQEAKDVLYIRQTEDSESMGLPYTLRPRPEKVETSEDADMNENVIMNIGKMSELVSHMHATMCRRPKIKVNITNRNGLCIYMSLECLHCGYKSPAQPISETVKPSRGPPAGALNNMLALSVLKSKIGLDDASNLLVCLNIKPPSKATLQKKMNSMAKTAVELNEKLMADNQKYVARVTAIAGAESTADVQFDVAYTCRPQGGCEKAAQSFGALIEHTTSRNLPLAISTANKHCKKKGCNHENCNKNFASEESIASSERVLLHRSLQKVDNAGHVKIRSITTDAGSQSAKAIRDYYNDRRRQSATHYKCLIHKLRTLEKNLRQLELKSIPRQYNKTAYLRKLACCIRSRVRLELKRLRKPRRGDAEFIRASRAAIENIVKCFSGDHRLCRQHSKVCISLVQAQYSHLPYGMPLKLNEADLNSVQLKLAQSFDNKGLGEVSRLYNTNMCESLNAAVFNYAPKATCWTRNFSALCHSATHSRTVGPGRATVQLAEAAGIPVKRSSVMHKKLTAKDRLRHYHRVRQASAKYKQARHYHRKRKMNKTLFKDSLYSSENASSCSAIDHSYGLNL